jgi:hypothetical protein
MDFSAIAQMLVKLGLPILGTAIAGPLGGAAAAAIGSVLGVPPTPEAINKAITRTDPTVAVEKLKQAEAKYVAAVQAQAQVVMAQVSETGQTMRKEIEEGLAIGGTWGRIAQFLQVSWRPLFAYETILQTAVMAGVICWSIVKGDTGPISNILQYQTVFISYMGFRYGVLGIYSWNRTQEKIKGVTSTATSAPDAVAGLVKDLVGKIR